MTPDQIVAILQLLADLRFQLGQVLQENERLRAQVDAVSTVSDG